MSLSSSKASNNSRWNVPMTTTSYCSPAIRGVVEVNVRIAAAWRAPRHAVREKLANMVSLLSLILFMLSFLLCLRFFCCGVARRKKKRSGSRFFHRFSLVSASLRHCDVASFFSMPVRQSSLSIPRKGSRMMPNEKIRGLCSLSPWDFTFILPV